MVTALRFFFRFFFLGLGLGVTVTVRVTTVLLPARSTAVIVSP